MNFRFEKFISFERNERTIHYFDHHIFSIEKSEILAFNTIKSKKKIWNFSNIDNFIEEKIEKIISSKNCIAFKFLNMSFIINLENLNSRIFYEISNISTEQFNENNFSALMDNKEYWNFSLINGNSEITITPIFKFSKIGKLKILEKSSSMNIFIIQNSEKFKIFYKFNKNEKKGKEQKKIKILKKNDNFEISEELQTFRKLKNTLNSKSDLSLQELSLILKFNPTKFPFIIDKLTNIPLEEIDYMLNFYKVERSIPFEFFMTTGRVRNALELLKNEELLLERKLIEGNIEMISEFEDQELSLGFFKCIIYSNEFTLEEKSKMAKKILNPFSLDELFHCPNAKLVKGILSNLNSDNFLELSKYEIARKMSNFQINSQNEKMMKICSKGFFLQKLRKCYSCRKPMKNEDLIIFTTCRHVFHRKCIKEEKCNCESQFLVFKK